MPGSVSGRISDSLLRLIPFKYPLKRFHCIKEWSEGGTRGKQKPDAIRIVRSLHDSAIRRVGLSTSPTAYLNGTCFHPSRQRQPKSHLRKSVLFEAGNPRSAGPIPSKVIPDSGDLSERSGDLSPRFGDLSESSRDLSPGPGEFSGCGGDLSPRSADLSGRGGDLSAGLGELSGGAGDLSGGA